MTKLTRTCSACGIEKPLSAFLYLSSQHGTAYGSICSTCRSKGITEQKQKKAPEEEHGSTRAGMQVGVKQLIEIERQRKQEIEKRKVGYEEESKKREHIAVEKIESSELKEKAEKSHREYIEAKQSLEAKRSLLNYQKKSLLGTASTVVGHREELFSHSPSEEKKRAVVESAKRTEAIKEEKRKTEIDLSGAPLESRHGYDVKYHNPLFNKFKTWVGVDSKAAKLTASQKGPEETPREFAERTWRKR